MTIKELLKLSPEDRQKLNEAELRRAVKFTAKVAKARRTAVKNFLQENGVAESTSYHDWSKASRGRTGVKNYWEATFDAKKGARINDLRHQLKINLSYLRAKTTTVSGTKSELLRIYRRISGNKMASWKDFMGSSVGDKSQFEKFWRVYDRIIKDDFISGQLQAMNLGSDRVQELIWQEMDENPYMSVEDIYEALSKKINDMYEGDNAANESVNEETRFTLPD